MAWLLMLVLVFNHFEVFGRLHGKLWQRGQMTLRELAKRLDRSLEHPDELTPLWSGCSRPCHPPGRRVSCSFSILFTRPVLRTGEMSPDIE